MKVTVDKQCVGKTLAQDVVDARGTILLSAGSVLGKRQLDLLTNRGILAVYILTDDSSQSANPDKEISEKKNVFWEGESGLEGEVPKRLQAIDRAFQSHRGNELMWNLRRCALLAAMEGELSE